MGVIEFVTPNKPPQTRREAEAEVRRCRFDGCWPCGSAELEYGGPG